MFAHPAYAASRAAYGCACGCGTCSPSSAYGASLHVGGGDTGGSAWAWDTSYYDSCPKYKEKVDAYEKARKKFESLPSFLGFRAGGRNSDVEKYLNKMKAAKRDGENARKRCESKEFSSEGAPAALSIEDAKKQVGLTDNVGGGEEDTGLGPLLYVGAAGVLGVGALIVWKLVTRKQASAA